MASDKTNINRAKSLAKKNKEKEIPQIVNIIKDDRDKTEIPKGSPTGICKTCGKKFDQLFVAEQNRYTDFKICQDCRIKARKEKSRKVKEEEVSQLVLPFELFPWQEKAFQDFQTHRFNLWACGNRCLLENDFIQGCNKLVQNVKRGDIVYNKNGNEQVITNVGYDEYDGYIYHIKSVGCLETVCNSEHPFLVCDIQKNQDRDKAGDNIIIKERFVKAESIENETYEKKKHGLHIRKYLKVPKITKTVKCTEWILKDGTKIPLNEDYAWLIGLYCAEGCIIGSSSKLTLNYKEVWLADKSQELIEKLGYHVNRRLRIDEGTCCIICSKTAYSFKMAQEIGIGSVNKHIPESILFNENDSILVSFLKGYFAGDGSYNKQRQSLYASTVSKQLALELQMAFVRLGYFAKLNYNKREKSKNADYTISCVMQEAISLLGYKCNKKNEHSSILKIGNDFYCPLITDIKKENKKCKIYFFATEDGTFVHNNQVNHNSGKDFAANAISIWYFAQCLNENRYIDHPEMAPSVLWWIIAPTEPMAKQNWRDLKKQFPKDWIVAVSNSTMSMETIGGGIIEVRSAYNPESLVGVGLDLVTITEAARISDLEVVWANLEARLGSPGRGLAVDRKGRKYGQGKAIINSTPIGKNYFYTMWKWGQKGSSEYSSAWVSYQLPWTCNPANEELSNTVIRTKYGEMTYEEDLRRRLGDRLYRQNYLADFLAMDGTVFKDFEERCVTNIFNLGLSKKDMDKCIKEWKEPLPSGIYRIGYDPATGSSADSPTIVVRDMNTNRIVFIEDMYGKNYDAQWDEIAFISKRYNYAPCAWLRTGHTAVENQLAKRGVVEIPLEEMGGRKAEYIQSMERAIQNDDFHMLLDGTIEAQTLMLQMSDYSEKNGKYSNEQQEHDDFVSACYAAWHDYSIETEKRYYFSRMSFVKR